MRALSRSYRILSSHARVPIDMIIKKDHEVIKDTCKMYRNSSDNVERQEYANQFIREVATHSVAEEIVLYPALRAKYVANFDYDCRFNQGSEVSKHLREEHHEIKVLLTQMDKMSQ